MSQHPAHTSWHAPCSSATNAQERQARRQYEQRVSQHPARTSWHAPCSSAITANEGQAGSMNRMSWGPESPSSSPASNPPSNPSAPAPAPGTTVSCQLRGVVLEVRASSATTRERKLAAKQRPAHAAHNLCLPGEADVGAGCGQKEGCANVDATMLRRNCRPQSTRKGTSKANIGEVHAQIKHLSAATAATRSRPTAACSLILSSLHWASSFLIHLYAATAAARSWPTAACSFPPAAAPRAAEAAALRIAAAVLRPGCCRPAAAWRA
eukprot:1159084-Pelagomonas_calceolata.AAC.4